MEIGGVSLNKIKEMKKVSVVIVLLFIFCFGCKKTYCPAFPVELANIYFPYYEKKVLSFSDNNETHTYQINDIYLSKEESYSKRCDCSCGANYYFETENSQLYGEISIGENSSFVLFTLKINSFAFYKEYNNINVFSVNDYSVLGDTITLNNRDGQTAILIKGKGLVSYTTADGEEWKLVE